jgi:hypothetical protein
MVPRVVAEAPALHFPRSTTLTEHNGKTKGSSAEFDFSSFPEKFLIHDRRSGRDRRDTSPRGAGGTTPRPDASPARPQRRAQKERRKRIDPTTFEKQYTDEELEFMNAMQRFKERTGKQFPTHGEVIKVAASLGYRKVLADEPLVLPSVEPKNGFVH